MKTTIAILALICLAAFSTAAPVKMPDGAIGEPPVMLATPAGTFQNPPAATLAAAGYPLATASEIAADAQAKADAAAAYAANLALYADPQPAVFVPRVGATITEIVGQSQIFVDSATSELFAVDETGSPEHTLAQKQKQADARKAKVASAKTAKGKGNGLNALADRVAALEALNGIE